MDDKATIIQMIAKNTAKKGKKNGDTKYTISAKYSCDVYHPSYKFLLEEEEARI